MSKLSILGIINTLQAKIIALPHTQLMRNNIAIMEEGATTFCIFICQQVSLLIALTIALY